MAATVQTAPAGCFRVGLGAAVGMVVLVGRWVEMAATAVVGVPGQPAPRGVPAVSARAERVGPVVREAAVDTPRSVTVALGVQVAPGVPAG